MKKDIYIIKNTINNKVYIGQAKNTKVRWAGHKSSAKCHGGLITIDKAMAKLGIENFYYEIIESQIENYNEREQYWILYYNSRIPYGYNYDIGGEGASVGIENACSAIKSQELLDIIINDLMYTSNSLKEIEMKTGISYKIISAINRGEKYVQENISYPIRARAADNLKNLDYKSIQSDLLNTDKSQNQIAREYNTTTYIISQINKGEKFYNENYSYPLKDFKAYPKVAKVKELLKNSNLSLHEIGRKCNISYTMVAHINIGKYHFDKNEKYPIR